MQRLDYDFSRLRMRPRDVKSSAARAKSYDWWVQRFLDDCPSARCCIWAAVGIPGSDRASPPSTVGWYDIDLPTSLRCGSVYSPGRPGLHTIAASVTDAHLLNGIPGDQPVLVVAEGLTCYLPRYRRGGDAATDHRTLPARRDGYRRLTAGSVVAHSALRAGESLRRAAGLEH